MKDAYSFDLDESGARESYHRVYEAYKRMFARLGLAFRPVEAETGNIGGSFSHEFMVLAESGEDAVVFCTQCDYAANVEKAEIGMQDTEGGSGREAAEVQGLEFVETPGKKTISDVTAFLGVAPSRLIKTLVCKTDDGSAAILVRGDREANEFKIQKVLGTEAFRWASPEEVLEVLGVPAGYVGPVGVEIPVYADHEIRTMTDAVVGANRENYHYLHLDPGRDLEGVSFHDLRNAEVGDRCPRCAGTVEKKRGIEVGHVFMLGTKYSKSLNAVYLDKDGKEQPIWMGCFGIGVGRTLAAAIEQNHDRDGICFPLPIAPFQVVLTALNITDGQNS